VKLASCQKLAIKFVGKLDFCNQRGPRIQKERDVQMRIFIRQNSLEFEYEPIRSVTRQTFSPIRLGRTIMRIRSTIFIAVVCLNQMASSSVTRGDEKDSKKVDPEAPIGFALVDEEQWHVMADEPDRHFSRAREAFLMADAKTAAAEMKKVAVHLRIASAHASERVKRGLVQSEHELSTLARHIESGRVKSVDELDAATARALHALSDYQFVRAAEAWRKREARVSGQYLRAATDNMERASARTDARMRAATAEVAKNSRVISSKLIEGTGYVIDEIGAGFETVGHEIERVGARVAPTKTIK
jgi:hypothetical protein